MTFHEANKIFKSWQEYAEINDKLMQTFLHQLPESFLPYPKGILEEALNIVAKNYFDAGNYKTSEAVKTTIAFLLSYEKDDEAFEKITNSAMFKSPKIKEVCLNNLQKSRNSWAEFKK